MAAPLAGMNNGLMNQAGLIKGTAGTKGAAALAAGGGGTIWTGKGLSLGLGLGLGIWGPILVVAAGAAAYYSYAEYRKRQQGVSDDAVEQTEQDEGFYSAQG